MRQNRTAVYTLNRKTRKWHCWQVTCYVVLRKPHVSCQKFRSSYRPIYARLLRRALSWSTVKMRHELSMQKTVSGDRFFQDQWTWHPRNGSAGTRTEIEIVTVINKPHCSRFTCLLVSFSRGTKHFTPFSIRSLDATFCAVIHISACSREQEHAREFSYVVCSHYCAQSCVNTHDCRLIIAHKRPRVDSR